MGKRTKSLLRFCGLSLLFTVLLAGPGFAADNFPNKPVTIMTGYNAGSVTDVGIRLLIPYLEAELGQPVTVLNKPGGSGWVAWSELAKAKPDGYTLAVVNVPNFHTGYLNPELKRQQSLKDFDFICNHISDPSAISVRADSPFKSVPEIIEDAKKNPGKLSITTTGPATDDHLMALMFESYAKSTLKIVHCPGGNESVRQVLGGHVDLLCENVGGIITSLRDKEIRLLAVASAARSPLVPEAPTLKELGFDFVNVSSRGIAGPKGIPADVKAKLEKAFEKAINNAEHIAKAEQSGLSVQYMGSAAYTDFMTAQEKEVKKWLGW